VTHACRGGGCAAVLLQQGKGSCGRQRWGAIRTCCLTAPSLPGPPAGPVSSLHLTPTRRHHNTARTHHRFYGGTEALKQAYSMRPGADVDDSYGVIEFGSCGFTNSDGTLAYGQDMYAALAGVPGGGGHVCGAAACCARARHHAVCF
jgi:hypothetical protein